MIKIDTPSTSVSGEIEDNVFVNNSRVASYDMNTIYITNSFGVSLANNVFGQSDSYARDPRPYVR